MLDPAAVARAETLLASGLPQREVARQSGLSRVSVWRIAHGLRRIVRQSAEDRSSPATRPAAWCSRCGALCTQPCVACAARSAIATEGRDHAA
jgi:hypothetical protein